MYILKTKPFQKWVKDAGVTDEDLADAVEEMENGLYEASLGGGIYKKRIALAGRGKRGGARTIVAFKMGEKAFFVHGFAKNEKGNISDQEKEELKEYAKLLFALGSKEIAHAINTGKLIEVKK